MWELDNREYKTDVRFLRETYGFPSKRQTHHGKCKHAQPWNVLDGIDTGLTASLAAARVRIFKKKKTGIISYHSRIPGSDMLETKDVDLTGEKELTRESKQNGRNTAMWIYPPSSVFWSRRPFPSTPQLPTKTQAQRVFFDQKQGYHPLMSQTRRRCKDTASFTEILAHIARRPVNDH
jgi:hypothetical protein